MRRRTGPARFAPWTAANASATYNYPENRITDHRIGFKAHNLDQVLDGDLDPMFDALAAADRQARLQEQQ